jgi:hypothetical protein
MDVHPNMALWLLTHTHLPFIPFILPTFEPPEVERVPRMALLKREGRACGACGQHRRGDGDVVASTTSQGWMKIYEDALAS